MIVTAEQVRATRVEGFAAGFARRPSLPNPYAPEYVPPWDQRRRTPAARAKLEAEDRPKLILARVWRVAFTRGQAEYARQHGRTLPES